VADWLRGPMKPMVDDCLLGSDSHMGRYFDQGYIRQMIRRHQQGSEPFMRHLYLLVSLELWHRTFIQA